MLCLFLLSVITISLSGIYSEHVVEGRSVEIDAGLLGCVTYCKSIGRKCFSPPRGCGSCLAHFYARDGVCLPDSEAQDDSKSSDASQSLQPSQNSQNSQDSQNSKNSQNTIVEGCPRLQCKQSCNNGHMKNHFNCPICQCLPAQQNSDINPACPMPMCKTDCPGGYANNAKGCMTCNCKHSAKEREVLNDDIDNLMERFRRIGEKHEEISKDAQAPEASLIARDSSYEDATTVAPPVIEKQVQKKESPDSEQASNTLFYAVVAGCSVAGLVGLVVAGVCWYRLQKNVKAASEVEYPAYGITGPTKGELGSPGDRKLAQSAQMYHYQHQKQQMIALEKANGEMKDNGSEDDSEEENEEGDYTVYECPGLAPTGEMEVKNPLFTEETPVTPTPDDRREMK